jgi:propanol-preferring alcohol dehydrogenase
VSIIQDFMNAAVLETYDAPLQQRKVPVPKPGPGQILVRLKACGVCHSDVHIWKGHVRPPSDPVPFILGHEGVGTVVATGPDVTGWEIGASAGVPWLHDTCCNCDECADGMESFCQNQRAHGLNVPGAFAQYVVADAAFAVQLPDGLDPLALAPIMCAGVTAYGAVKRSALRAGETCAIFGCGGLGLYAVQIATRLGARVIAIDRDPAKLELARRYGAAATLLADDTLTKTLGTEPYRSHVCINFAPTAATWAPMIAAIRPRGRIVAAALVPDPVPVSQEWLTATGVVITGTSVGTREEMRDVVALHAAKPLENDIVPITLDGVSGALRELNQGKAAGRFVIAY